MKIGSVELIPRIPDIISAAVAMLALVNPIQKIFLISSLRENLSDAVGGVSDSGEPAEVTDILLDLTRRETQAFSISMADSVVRSFEGQVALINNPHRYAGFRVLQAHEPGGLVRDELMARCTRSGCSMRPISALARVTEACTRGRMKTS